MTLKASIIIGTIVMVLLGSSQIAVAFGSNEEEKDDNDDNNNPFQTNIHANRPAINPDFNPDEDCNIAYELKCIPGSQQSCFELEGYHNGEDNVCSPIDCPEDYHSEDDDETGLCYPNEDGCRSDNMVLFEREDGNGWRCGYLSQICDDEGYRNEDYCLEYLEYVKNNLEDQRNEQQ